MTSYMYNPSKKVTELLSEYLEFDAEQIKIGIWSGHLSLRNVQLRADSFYPLLNHASVRAACADSSKEVDPTCRPPLRFKVVSGTVGEFDIQIPWKRLVWGQGDVRVQLRNVVLVLALETRQETTEREERDRRGKNAATPLRRRSRFNSIGGNNDTDTAKTGSTAQEQDSNQQRSRRVKKQKRLREAERRISQGRSLGPWLAHLQKKDLEEERAQSLLQLGTPGREQASNLNKWFQGTIQDFFWRFYAGLQLNVENIRVMIVQDGVEIGLIVPSVDVAAGKHEPRTREMDQNQSEGSTANTTEIMTDSSILSNAPADVIYEGEHDDGEHVEKSMQVSQLGVYIRSITVPTDSSQSYQLPPDISPRDFLIRPVDIGFRYSQFFPFPPEKRKKKAMQGKPEIVQIEPTDNASSMGSKTRRSKRDKSSSYSTPSVNTPTRQITVIEDEQLSQASTTGLPLPQMKWRSSITEQRKAPFSSALNSSSTARGSFKRRTSLWAPPMKGTELPGFAPVSGDLQASMLEIPTNTVPLVQPQNMVRTARSIKARVSENELATRFDGKCSVGIIQFACSSKQCRLLAAFITGSVRLQNGRPTTTIRALREQTQKLRRSVNMKPPVISVGGLPRNSSSDSDDSGSPRARLDLNIVEAERSQVIASWWQYCAGAVLWEVRQRRRLRRAFKERFLSFDWEKQRYRRSEYIRLYIHLMLRKQSYTLESTPTMPTLVDEDLMLIEDELPIEQILLYRSLAHALQIQGETKMPASILGLRRIITDSMKEGGTDRSVTDQATRMHTVGENISGSALTHIEAHCETCRNRRDTHEKDILPVYNPKTPWSILSQERTDADESSLLSMRTGDLGLSVVADADSVGDEVTGLLYSFDLNIEQLQCMIIEDYIGDDSPVCPFNDGGSTASDAQLSNVSVLTDDFRHEKTDYPFAKDQDNLECQLDPTADYFIFSLPEKTFLRLVISSVDFSLLGNFGRFNSISFCVCKVEAFGETENNRLLCMGTGPLALSQDVVVSTMAPPLLEKGVSMTSGRRAIVLSLMSRDRGIGTALQVDAATVKLTPDVEAIDRVVAFAAQNSIRPPQSILPRSPMDDLRLHVLRQSSVSFFIRLNTSARINGFEVFMKPTTPFLSSSESPSRCQDESPLCIVRVNLIEFYSGTAVNGLSSGGTFSLHEGPTHAQHKLNTRRLKLLGDKELGWSESVFTNKWVVAVSGLNFEVLPGRKSLCSLLQRPVDLEILLYVSKDSAFTLDRAKTTMFAKLSAVLLSVTRVKVETLMLCFSRSVTLPDSGPLDSAEDDYLLPRLEMMSRYIVLSAEIDVAQFRIGVSKDDSYQAQATLRSYEDRVKSVLSEFVEVALCFDLNFPHDEALSSAMQICIDRLGGLGILPREAWRVANEALRNSLEELSSDGHKESNESDDVVYSILSTAISKAMESSCDESSYLALNRMSIPTEELVFDFSEGMKVSILQLFYDECYTVSVPSMYILNGTGLHLLRVATPDDTPDIPGENTGFLDKSEGDDSYSALQRGLSFRLFKVDKGTPFGRGGLSLDVLGRNTSLNARRECEKLVDIDFDEIEILISRVVAAGVAESLTELLQPVAQPSTKGATQVSEHGVRHAKFDVFIFSRTLSLLLVSESLVPFARVDLERAVVKTSSKEKDLPLRVLVRSEIIDILNLSPDSEHYSSILTALPTEHTGIDETVQPTLVAVYNELGRGFLDVSLYNIRLVYLHRYFSEFAQFLFSDEYGLFQVFSKPELQQDDGQSGISYRITCCESSILLPRSTWSSDIVAVEIESLSVESSRASSSFNMPSAVSSLEIGEADIISDFHDSLEDRESPDGRCNGATIDQVSRNTVRFRGARIFTSLSTTSSPQDDKEDPSFFLFHSLHGRAEEGKPVYEPRRGYSADVMLEHSNELRYWREITESPVSINLLVEYAPHLRILIMNPSLTVEGNLCLDVYVSQFCLLLSIWFCNLQELPIMFPFAPSEIERAVKDPSSGVAYPAVGTEPLKSILLSPSVLTSEVCLVLDEVSLRLKSDPFGSDGEPLIIKLQLKSAVLHVTFDEHGVGRIGLGCSMATLFDESLVFDVVIRTTAPERISPWADINFGLEGDFATLGESLRLPFQLSIFLTPSWTIYNLGLHGCNMVLANLEPIWKFLEMVTAFFSDEKYGHPWFAVHKEIESLKDHLMRQLNINKEVKCTTASQDSGLDFRLWLTSPQLAIPCRPHDPFTSYIRVKAEGGLWYRYTCVDVLSFHDCMSAGLSLEYCEGGTICDFNHSNRTRDRMIAEGLSFGFRMDYNEKSKHTDYSFRTPFHESTSCGFESKRFFVEPTVLPHASICNPYRPPQRCVGPKVCELTCILEVLPETCSTVIGFLSPVSELPADDSSRALSSRNSFCDQISANDETDVKKETFSVSSSLSDIRVFFLDPILGPHLPVAVVSLGNLNLTASLFAANDTVALYDESAPGDLQISVETLLWADYFKLGMTRSWEPLIEAHRLSVLFEKSSYRGTGVLVSTDVPLHVNLSSAFLVIVGQVFPVYDKIIREMFDSNGSNEQGNVIKANNIQASMPKAVLDKREGKLFLHKKPEMIQHLDKVAFSLKNMSGQRIRVLGSELAGEDNIRSTAITYLDHNKSVNLSFQPSVTIVENLNVKEVSYPGLNPNSEEIALHLVNIQLPGCEWIHDMKVDTFGRTFADISPKSASLTQVATDDWHVRNLMKVLIEVGLENGGRQVTVRSLFSILNRTCHRVKVFCHPDLSNKPGQSDIGPRIGLEEDYTPDVEDEYVDPGESYCVPTLLVLEALNRDQNNVGSLWVKPDTSSMSDGVLCSFGDLSETSDVPEVSFSSQAIRLSKIVQGSSIIFENARGSDVPPTSAASSLQLSCPVVSRSGDRLAPFCYAVEVGRSPLVRANSIVSRQQDKKAKYVHGPVLYTLTLHAPFVVANLLPKRGRFELLHAVRRTVVWCAELDPGEEISIYSVGLDAPLLLLINLRFCRTPIGEGALVHHGTDPKPGIRENIVGLKSIGKAGKAVTRQLGKTLTAISESPDKRAQEKLAHVQNPNLFVTSSERNARNLKRMADTGASVDRDLDVNSLADGKTYRVDSSLFLPQDVASQTIVVDGVGQRLTLGIENIRGNGGQRRISVFCPIWIVNTTEHSLRYRQENSKAFVSGTVVSPDRNGSLPMKSLDFSKKQDLEERSSSFRSRIELEIENESHVFSGMAGALASTPGICSTSAERVAKLVDVNLPPEELTHVAFMFNFHDELSIGIGNQRLSFQLGDGTGVSRYQSEWSRGISVDSVGIPQVINMHCKEGRFLEVTVLVHVASGWLTNYTKIVRILPRFVVVNSLPYPIRLWQDSTDFRAAEEASVLKTERKWKGPRESTLKSRVNLYEMLWGREARLDEGFRGKITPGTAANQGALYISTYGEACVTPFHLPDSRIHRQIRVDLGLPWSLTASFAADVVGDHVLEVSQAVDLKMLPHISTRASPEYVVAIQPGTTGAVSELGLWFETEWGSRSRITVKAIKKASYAFKETDIHVGDELRSVDGLPVSSMPFPEVMSLLRRRFSELSATSQTTRRVYRRSTMLLSGSRQQDTALSSSPLILGFRTVEERLRRVRLKAAKDLAHEPNSLHLSPEMTQSGTSELVITPEGPPKYIRAELKNLHHMMFIVLREEDSPPFEIRNQTVASTIYYRQKGCNAHSWYALKPGKTTSYSWQEPMRTKRLSMCVAAQYNLSLSDTSGEVKSSLDSRDRSQVRQGGVFRRMTDRFRKVPGEADAIFSPTTQVRLEEIGFRDFLPTPDSKSWIELEVDVVGATRVLVVRDLTKGEGDEIPLNHRLEVLRKLIVNERSRLTRLNAINEEIVASAKDYGFKGSMDSVVTTYNAADDAIQLMTDITNKKHISGRHQVVVEVIEAMGLNIDAFTRECNPYAEVMFKSYVGRRHVIPTGPVCRTYHVKKSIKPQWHSQSFVFDVPASAVEEPRGHSVCVRLRNYRSFGYDKVLGTAYVDLRTLRNQEPLVGWFPLAGRAGRIELENHLSHWGRGSVRLRVQWIFSIPALIQYFSLLSQSRLLDLNASLDGLTDQRQDRQSSNDGNVLASDGSASVQIHEVSDPTRKVFPIDSSSPYRSEENWQIESNVVDAESESALYSKLNKSRDLLDSDSSRTSIPLLCQSDRTVFHQCPKVTNLKIRWRELARHVVYRSHDPSGDVVISLLRSYDAAKVIVNDQSLAVTTEGSHIVARYSNREGPGCVHEVDEFCDSVSTAMRLPLNAPHTFREFAEQQASLYLRARKSFESYARRSLASILHRGGWLTIRPIRALNLPDSYSTMFVKLRYGSKILVTGSVDARVSPTWSESTVSSVAMGSPRSSRRVSVKDERNAQKDNDFHVYVTPQRTNAFIRISVHGEKGQQQLQAKTELGIVYLPLGNVIAACIENEPTIGGRAIYEKWFPLISPLEAVPVEGDGGLSTRAPESEKDIVASFEDHYRPCIQLALIWQPDIVSSQTRETGREVPRKIMPTVKSYFISDIARVSAALIDSERAIEILSFNAIDIDVRYWVTVAKTRLAITAFWLQIDQQDENAREPVVLAPTPNDMLLPVTHVFAVKDNVRSEEVDSFDYIDISVAEFDLTIEESLLNDLFVFQTLLQRRRMHRTEPTETNESFRRASMASQNRDEEPSLLLMLSNGFTNPAKRADRIYIQQLFLGVLKVNLSYVKGKRSVWETGRNVSMITKQLLEEVVKPFSTHHVSSEVFASWSQQTSNEDRHMEDKVMQSLPKLLASLLPNVSDAPIRLQGKALNHVFESPSEILHSIRKFYMNEIMRQLYKIIGSVDFVGNPTMLVSSFVSGVRDLVVTPSTAFLNSPTDATNVGIGVAKGALSLVSHSASGLFAVFAKVSATAGQAVALLSLDREFSDWHREHVVNETTNINRHWKKRGVQSARAMIMRPIGDVIIGVGGGLFGLVIAPVKGFHRDNLQGLITGLAIGSIGVIARPLVGVLDALAHFTASIHDIAKSVNILERRLQPAHKLRLPYTFGLMSILMPFDERMSRASLLLQAYPLKRSQKASLEIPETIVHVEVLPNVGNDTVAVVTSARVILIRVGKEPSGTLSYVLCWELFLSNDIVISSRVTDHGHSGVALVITTTRSPAGQRVGAREHENIGEMAIPSETVDSDDMVDYIESTTPEETTPTVTGDKHYEHRSAMGKQGENVEWFTIVAEYQYRSELENLHNAICCIVGDYDSLLHTHTRSDGALDTTDGYRTFGIYHFCRDSQVSQSSNKVRESIAVLDVIPWISEQVFREAHSQSIRDQQEYLSDTWQDWTFQKQLEASKEEGGPEWLVVARASALMVTNAGIHSSDPDDDLDGIVSITTKTPNKASTSSDDSKIRRSVGWSDARSPRGLFSGLSNISRDVRSTEQESNVVRSESSGFVKVEEERVVSGDTATKEDSEHIDISQPHDASTSDLSENCDKGVTSRGFPGRMSSTIRHSFVTAVGTIGNLSSGAAGTIGTISSSLRDRNTTRSLSSKPPLSIRGSDADLVSFVSDVSEGHDHLLVSSGDLIMPRKQHSRQFRHNNVVESLTTTASGAGSKRLDRMESLLEGLLMLSSEHVLTKEKAKQDEIGLLRQEIREIKNLLRGGLSSSSTNSDATEISKLKEEIALLKAQMMSASVTATTGTERPPPPPPPPEEVDDEERASPGTNTSDENAENPTAQGATSSSDTFISADPSFIPWI